MGCDIFSKPTKEMQILENDERNITIINASLANAYKVTLTLLVPVSYTHLDVYKRQLNKLFGIFHIINFFIDDNFS